MRPPQHAQPRAKRRETQHATAAPGASSKWHQATALTRAAVNLCSTTPRHAKPRPNSAPPKHNAAPWSTTPHSPRFAAIARSTPIEPTRRVTGHEHFCYAIWPLSTKKRTHRASRAPRHARVHARFFVPPSPHHLTLGARADAVVRLVCSPPAQSTPPTRQQRPSYPEVLVHHLAKARAKHVILKASASRSACVVQPLCQSVLAQHPRHRVSTLPCACSYTTVMPEYSP